MPKANEITAEHVNVGLQEHQRKGVVETLNVLLADETVLYLKTRNYHWNVVGPRFNDLHKFFEQQYTGLEKLIDEIAENARQFGGTALGTMTEYLQVARIREEAGVIPADDTMIRNLLEDHETIIRELRPAIERADEEFEAADAADFLTAVLEAHNKMAWMLRAYLPKEQGNIETRETFDHELVGNRR